MAIYHKPFTNYIWLAWFSLQVPIILCKLIDMLHFYPTWLYKPTDSPLHFAEKIQQNHIATYNDPYVQWLPATAVPSGHDSWIGLFLYIELAFLLPTALYGVYRLGLDSRGRKQGTSGGDELLFLVYAFETALTTLVCVHDVFYWDKEVYSPEVMRSYQVNLLGPWLVIPSLMFVDMASRIMKRVRVADAAVQGKKMQ
ncbi:transmembrane protein 6/97 [Bombardia bombarda]|uniref:Transmembrane protein 6/97 n=1 Tax=Bombardia bombarda TaxID=252184 RepID=A0AA39WLU7_9PEZI|nr:transmembrane protein 6/97 [Bombardia bombarda]